MDTQRLHNGNVSNRSVVLSRLVRSLFVAWLLLAWPKAGAGQGVLTYDWPGLTNGIAYLATWPEGGLILRVIPPPPLTRDGILYIGVGLAGYPYNGTPYIAFQRHEGNPDYVMIARTNNLPFGLASVDLADPVAPSPAPIAITFNGFRADGSMVSQTFTVGGGGSSSFQTFYFGPDFAHGLVRVEIPSPAWAMDNLVWIPEPGPVALLGLGLLVWWLLRRRISIWVFPE